ncbi:MAG TPA: N-acetyltransferase [Ktedonobacteraceae bacterium]|nr:N-acetyltransferase [Ktedonobacteraceae bacterium]
MIDEKPTTPLVVRIATAEDIPQIERLDSFSTSPTRFIHRAMEKYFGPIDPSTHEQILIFLAEVAGVVAAKAELMLPPLEATETQEYMQESMRQPIANVGYVKRVVVHPDYRKLGLARTLMHHILAFARTERTLEAIDLHVWEENVPAIRLYESLGFELQHRERYYRLPL